MMMKWTCRKNTRTAGRNGEEKKLKDEDTYNFMILLHEN
jgi:hypothetical protein